MQGPHWAPNFGAGLLIRSHCPKGSEIGSEFLSLLGTLCDTVCVTQSVQPNLPLQSPQTTGGGLCNYISFILLN